MRHERILLAAQQFCGWSYGALDRVAHKVDCCSLTAATLANARQWPTDMQLGSDAWKALNVIDPAFPFSPIFGNKTVTFRSPLRKIYRKSEGPPDLRRGSVVLCQGWKGLYKGSAVKGSAGHAWLWLSFGGARGVVLESSGYGPRIYDAKGKVYLGEFFSVLGRQIRPLEPMDFSVKADKWTDGVAYREIR